MNELSKAHLLAAMVGIAHEMQMVPGNDCFKSPIQSRIGRLNPPKSISRDERIKRRSKRKAAEASRKKNRK